MVRLARGPAGAKGNAGNTGSQGIQGIQGATGPAGSGSLTTTQRFMQDSRTSKTMTIKNGIITRIA